MTVMPRDLSDTDEASDRVHLDLLRQASPARRLALALSVSATVVGLSRRGLARAEPALSPGELELRFVELSYGQPLAHAVRDFLIRRAS